MDWAEGSKRMARRQLKVVKLLEPDLCIECRFAQMASVELQDGTVQRMVHCRRLDCDNWDTTTAETAKGVRAEEEGA
ncbi:MAG: hypothetical protein KF884_06145 [Fimbriimonadaceae bacterium]|nr:hypothetical protein [Fimbriimonadaceae bacterium]QYK59665.1 MAG: hypothetical protein KF884_06145 [Fimbriimonadaceae bacterium]